MAVGVARTQQQQQRQQEQQLTERAVEAKGRDVSVSVEELVGRLVGEATSDANLARMFEGWMAWL